MKVNINIQITDAPFGGGNQFLKALKNYFISKEIYTENKKEADIILFNSHHKMFDNLVLKYKFPKKFFIHRIDGPMEYRGDIGKKLDKKIFKLSNSISNGQVFQSNWSFNEIIKKFSTNKNYSIISNAPDPEIFYKKNFSYKEGSKIKLIANSWSNNPKKGEDILEYLDLNLDFNKYEMTFVGNINKCLKKIKVISPLETKQLADVMRSHDVFIFASEIEACSNSLIEALSCGLPAIARNTSSNPEVLSGSGELFNNKLDIIEKIDLVSSNLSVYYNKIKTNNISNIGNYYINFFEELLAEKDYKQINIFKFIQLAFLI